MFHSVEDTLTVIGQGVISFVLPFSVGQGTARFIGSDDWPRPSCDPDKGDRCTMAIHGSIVTITWHTYSKRDIIWVARGCSA